MIVIKSGFRSVLALALSENRVAVQNKLPLFVPWLADPADYTRALTWDAEVWDIHTHQPRRFTLCYSETGIKPEGCLFEPKSRLPIWWGDQRICGADGIPIVSPRGHVWCCAISPDGTRLVCGIRVRDELDAVRQILRHHDEIVLYQRDSIESDWSTTQRVQGGGSGYLDVAFLPDGKRFAITQRVHTPQADGTFLLVPGRRLHLLDSNTLKTLDSTHLEEAGSDDPSSLVVVGNHLVFTETKKAYLVDLSNMQSPLIQLKTGRRKVKAIAADPRGRFLLTASGKDVSVWDTKTWTITKTYNWKAGAITCLVVAPDGLTAAAGTNTGKVVIWDID